MKELEIKESEIAVQLKVKELELATATVKPPSVPRNLMSLDTLGLFLCLSQTSVF